MFKRISTKIILVLLLMSITMSLFNIQLAKAGTTTVVVPYDYPTIQEAVNHAISGDTIFVSVGTYYENIVVNKTVLLIGEDHANTIIDGNQCGIVVSVNVNSVVIANFTITNSGHKRGIYLENIRNCKVENNNIINNSWGIELVNSSSNRIHNNKVSGCNETAVVLQHSMNNTIYENKITKNVGVGIYLYISSRNCIYRNDIRENVAGGFLQESSYNSIFGNNITGSRTGGFLFSGSSYNTISGNSVTENDDGGIYFVFSGSYNNICWNNITNTYGIGVGFGAGPSFNNVFGNNIINNYEGISMYECATNIIYHNNFIDNYDQIVTTNSSNIWDCEYPIGGNYWSDYSGTDFFNGPYQNITGSDGIADTPRIIDESNRDRYPLLTLYIRVPFDLNNDRFVDIKDIFIAAMAYGSYPGRARWNIDADINKDGWINIHDLYLIAKHFGEALKN